MDFRGPSSDSGFRILLVLVSEEGDGKCFFTLLGEGERQRAPRTLFQRKREKQPFYSISKGRHSRRTSLNSRQTFLYTLNDQIQMFFLTSWLEDPNSKKWVQFVYEIEISIYAIVLSVIAIMSVDTWKNVFTK